MLLFYSLPLVLTLEQPARAASPQQLAPPNRAEQARNISHLIQPCARRSAPPSVAARGIGADLRVHLSRDGVPTSHEIVNVTGVNDANRSQVDQVVAIALRVVRACASRLATLPAEQYDVEGGWKSFRYRFRFP